MIRILLAEDHAIVREGLKQLLQTQSDILVAAEATSGEEVQRQLPQVAVDLLMLDMSMPGLCGEPLIIRLHAAFPELPILVLSMHNEPQVARRALHAGARGYITKDQSPEVLLAGIRKVAAGGRFIDPALAEQLIFDLPPCVAGRGPLSEREFEILGYLAKGVSVNEIASLLGISNKTVSTHKARLMEKMGFTSNADLVRYVLIRELGPDGPGPG